MKTRKLTQAERRTIETAIERLERYVARRQARLPVHDRWVNGELRLYPDHDHDDGCREAEWRERLLIAYLEELIRDRRRVLKRGTWYEGEELVPQVAPSPATSPERVVQ